jgi:hypothetical protein
MDEERPEPLSAGGDGVSADGRDEPGRVLDGGREPLLELVEVRCRLLQDGLGFQGRTATWRATLPPPRSR